MPPFEPWMIPAALGFIILLCVGVSILVVAAPDRIFGVDDEEF